MLGREAPLSESHILAARHHSGKAAVRRRFADGAGGPV